jgi:hypothetical protein
MIPNLAGAMAESPQLLEGFLKVREILYVLHHITKGITF